MLVKRVAITCVVGIAAIGLLMLSATLIGRASRRPVIYPPGWPVPQLTAPDKAWAADVVDFMSTGTPERSTGHQFASTGSPKACEIWVAGFDTRDDWNAVCDHVEQCLKPLGYLRAGRSEGIRVIPGSPQLGWWNAFHGPMRSASGMYASSNHVYLCRLLYLDHSYSLSISRYVVPLNPVTSPAIAMCVPIP
jgi:hypothetical protein